MDVGDIHSKLNKLWHATPGEGHSGELAEQTLALANIIKFLPPNARILEIGFNCGHSAATMLCTRNDISILSLDLGLHGYVSKAKLLIDQIFPGRHELVLGDSTQTMANIDGNFDMFFIDGGHEYSIALQDAKHCLALARPTDVILIDDVCKHPKHEYTVGPSRVWREMTDWGLIREKEHLEWAPGARGWAWGYPSQKGVKVK